MHVQKGVDPVFTSTGVYEHKYEDWLMYSNAVSFIVSHVLMRFLERLK